jgi:hypothetical protein
MIQETLYGYSEDPETEICSSCHKVFNQYDMKSIETSEVLYHLAYGCFSYASTSYNPVEYETIAGKWNMLKNEIKGIVVTWLCSECFDNEYLECSICSKQILESEDKYITSDCEIYCEDCADKELVKCADCGEYVLADKAYNGYCEDCYQNYFTCDSCGYSYHMDNACSDRDSMYCEHCYSSVQHAKYNKIFDTEHAWKDEFYAKRHRYRKECTEFFGFWRTGFVPSLVELYVTEYINSQTYSPNIDSKDYFYRDNRFTVQDNLHFSRSFQAQLNRLRSIDTINSALAEFWINYILIICIGEARHLPQNDHNPSTVPEWLIYNNSADQCSRTYCFEYGYFLATTKSKQEKIMMLSDLMQVYQDNDWSSSYGGSKWYRIAKHAYEFLIGTHNTACFTDGAVSLAHNGSLCIDKLGVSASRVKALLDMKFNAKIVTDYKTIIDKYAVSDSYRIENMRIVLNRLQHG